jgi:hypothetical protein
LDETTIKLSPFPCTICLSIIDYPVPFGNIPLKHVPDKDTKMCCKNKRARRAAATAAYAQAMGSRKTPGATGIADSYSANAPYASYAGRERICYDRRHGRRQRQGGLIALIMRLLTARDEGKQQQTLSDTLVWDKSWTHMKTQQRSGEK